MSEIEIVRSKLYDEGFKEGGHRIYSIHDLNPFREVIAKLPIHFGHSGWKAHYRGQSKDKYKLESGIHRFKKNFDDLKEREAALYFDFIKRVEVGEFDFIKPPKKHTDYEFSNEWSYLFQGQHLGLATRLLDWSLGWDKALLFAVNEEKYHGEDGNYWIFLVPEEWYIKTNVQDLLNTNPLKLAQPKFINFPFFQETMALHGEENRWKQVGRFFVQDFDSGLTPMEEQTELKPLLFKFIIDGDSKAAIKKELNDRQIIMDSIYRTNNSLESSLKSLNNKFLK